MHDAHPIDGLASGLLGAATIGARRTLPVTRRPETQVEVRVEGPGRRQQAACGVNDDP